jgi:DNA-binding NtrC family response regulator
MTTNRQAPGTRILRDPSGTPSLHVRRARLRVVAGPDAGREVVLGGVSLTVGSDAACDLVVGDTSVSARHFGIAASEHGVALRDLGSTNGTFVDGYRVGLVYLNETATIEAGRTTLELSVGGEGDDVAIPLSRATNFGGLLGHSPSMRAAFAVLEAVSKTDVTVLVLGESGTGKELAARGIHERSPRHDGPFVVFDAGAASPTLVESQLFGHARGAFTGATDAREGCFEAAAGGTLVLDEIGELPPELQPKLLRALERKCVVRLGESAERACDVRLVACTNRNLEEEVRAGRFRQDLYFRLAVVTARLPALRERKEEVARLARHFAQAIAGDAAPEIPPSLVRMLEAHDWPGNVRELRNFVERWIALRDVPAEALLGPRAAPSKAAGAPAVDPGVDARVPYHDAKERFLERFEKAYLEQLLAAHGGNLSEAARVAGLSRQTCYRLMHKHGLGVSE